LRKNLQIKQSNTHKYHADQQKLDTAEKFRKKPRSERKSKLLEEQKNKLKNLGSNVRYDLDRDEEPVRLAKLLIGLSSS
jgi:hypothetical protein